MMRNLLITVILLSILPVFTGCNKPETSIPRPDGKLVVTRYGEKTITVQDVLVAFQKSHSYSELAANSILPAAAVISAITDELIFTREMADKAIGLKLNETSSFQEFRNNVIKEELYQKLLVEDVLQKITISENDVRRFYDENKMTTFKKPKTNIYTIRGIRISTKEHTENEANERVQKVLELLKKGHSFESVAAEYSDADLDKRGKEMPIAPGEANVEVEKRIAALKDGDYTEPFRIGNDIFIDKRERFVPPAYTPFAEVRFSIIDKLLQEERERRITVTTQNLMQKFNCLSNAALLDAPKPDKKLIILSVAGVYELTVEQFEKLAAENQQETQEEKKSYLSLLGPKAVCYAEALERKWNENNVAKPLHYWETGQLAKDLIYHKVINDDKYSDEKLRAVYEKNKDTPKMKKADQYAVYCLFFKAPISLSMTGYERQIRFTQAKQKAQRALELIKQGQPFENLISQLTNDQNSGVSGGLLGLLPMDKRLVDKIGTLGTGEVSSEPKYVSNVGQDHHGYEIYYVKEVIPGEVMTFDEMKNNLLAQLASRLYNEEHKQFNEVFYKEVPMKFNKDTVEQIIKYLIFLRDNPDKQIDIVRYAEILETK